MSFFPKQHASRVGATQTIAYDSSVAIANAFGAGDLSASPRGQFRLLLPDRRWRADRDDRRYVSAGQLIEYVIVSPGQRISAIKAATNGLVTATAGTLWVTEMS